MSPKALMDRWQPLISEASKRFAVPENWIRAVMRIESGGRTVLFGRPITSGAGAMGLMQLMGDTYNEMRARNGLGADPYDARDNIMAGAAYLRELYMKYGYPRLFAAYNAGPGRLEEHLHSGHALPAETRTYVRLATDGAVPASFGAAKPVTKKGAKTRIAAVYLPAS
jgi:soluble lytic murein transglycosylase-like protein